MKLPELFVKRMEAVKDFDIAKFLESYNLPPEHGIRLNPQKISEFPENVFGKADKVPWCETGFYINKELVKGTHPYHMAGLFYFQEPSAMCAGAMFDFKEGDVVLDLCAAPGGKSTQIAAENGITLVSNEIIPKRSAILSENIERMGFSNVVVTNESPERLEEKFRSFFDKIIIDAPCSGEGMFKKEPAASEAWSPEHVEACALRQRKIIDSAMNMLKQGGEIVYSTCTFAPSENEENVAYILEKYPYMEVLKTHSLYPHIVRGEGHFAAHLRDTREAEFTNAPQKDKAVCPKDAVSAYTEFEKKYLKVKLQGEFVLFGENLYLKPCGIPIDGIKTVRPGLHLGVCKKGRFEPGHALAKALKADDFVSVADYGRDSAEINKYLKGETLSGDISGYAVVTCDGYPMGWVKGSGGVLKNKLPKGIRIF